MYGRERLEISVYQHLCFASGNVETLGKSEDGYAVDDSEIGTLSLRALVAADLVNVLFIYACSCCSVDVMSFAERLYHVLVTRQVCHDAQFNLAVVGREKEASGFGYEGASDFLSVLAANRYVLQVWI